LGSFFCNYERSPNLGLLFSTWSNLCINFGKNVLGYSMGKVLTNSSGHPAHIFLS
jgi:hypothetical protein